MKIDITKLTIEEVLDLKAQLASIKICGRDNHPDIDWTKSNQVIAQETGLSAQYVGVLRKRAGQPKVTKYWPAAKDWDWTKSNTELSREHGVEIYTAGYLRAKAGAKAGAEAVHGRDLERMPKTIREPVNQIREQTKAKYEALDWTKPDITLSKEVGISRERVRQWRVKLGKPKVYKWQLRLEKFKTLVNGDEEIYPGDARFSDFTRGTILRYARHLGVGIVRSKGGPKEKYPWHLFDWRLPNKVLAEIWDMPAIRVAIRRSQKGMDRALYHPSTMDHEARLWVEQQKRARTILTNGNQIYEENPINPTST